MKENPHIFISCGERSGDEHAALLVKEIYKHFPNSKISAQGGTQLQALGVTLVHDITLTAGIMGFSAVIKNFSSILKTFTKIKNFIITQKPDVCIFIDYPDFNLRLAKVAKTAGIKTLYFIPPKVWAWRKSRVELFKKYIDQTAVIFPFEADFFKNSGYQNVTFVGHPFVDEYKDFHTAEAKKRSRELVQEKQALSKDKKIIALFPGSRKSEIASHASLSAGLITRLKSINPECEIIIAATPALEEHFESFFTGAHIITDIPSMTLLQAADCAVLKSGTSNVQAAFTNTPSCMFFKTTLFNQCLVKLFVYITSYSPLNIILPHTVREYVQEHANAADITAEVIELLGSGTRIQQQLANYTIIRELLTVNNDSQSTQKHVVSMLQSLLKK